VTDAEVETALQIIEESIAEVQAGKISDELIRDTTGW